MIATLPSPIPSSPAAVSVPAPTPLSPREREVLTLLARGQSNKAIARALSLSPHTVKRHVTGVLTKLSLSRRSEAAAWYHLHPRFSGCCGAH